MKPFAIIRTNVGLTTNYKLMITNDDSNNLFIDSIDSDPILSDSIYKKVQFNKLSFFDEILSDFFNGLPVDTAYHVKYNNDNNIMYTSFDNQFDDLYQLGCRQIIDNKDYSQDYEYFAPLYLYKNSNIPSNFIVFRVDGPGIIDLNSKNFKSEIIDNMKVVQSFDLTTSSNIGYFLYNTINNNNFPLSPFYMEFKNLQFSYWNGVNYDIGGYISNSTMMDSMLEYENTYMDFEKFIYDGYKKNHVIFPNIFNLSFVFSDNTLPNDKTWTMNRYIGFYMDDIKIDKKVTAYKLANIQTDIIIKKGNVLYSSYEYPFIDNWEENSLYIEIKGGLYLIEKYITSTSLIPNLNKTNINNNITVDNFSSVNTYAYKIISDVDFSGVTYSSINTNNISINNNIITLNNKPLFENIDNYNSSDIWLLNIDTNYYRITYNVDTNQYFILSDYVFNTSNNELNISLDGNTITTVNLTINVNAIPINFNIMKCKFTDIKDFDTSIVNTDYSKFEYEIKDNITNTDETKMYSTDYSDKSIPQPNDTFTFNNNIVNIPCSSEYTSNGELFSIVNNDLNILWRKNPIRCKWGYQGSLSTYDYPYLLNNSFSSENYNRSVNIDSYFPNRKDRNLDYFYTIGTSFSQTYEFQSLNIMSYSFSYNDYVTTSNTIDYFEEFFNGKYSYFTNGDDAIPNITLFRGIKFALSNVSKVQSTQLQIDNIITSNNNNFDGYKFSILLDSENTNNSLSWDIIEEFQYNKVYTYSTIINYQDVLYQSITNSIVSNQYGFNLNGFVTYSNTYSIFWNPDKQYNNNDVVYRYKEYYYYDNSGTIDFWNPVKSYNNNDLVFYKEKLYQSIVDTNIYYPTDNKRWVITYSNYTLNEMPSVWKNVYLWNPNLYYDSESYSIYNNILYQSVTSSSIQPGKNLDWKVVYSMIPDNSYLYSNNNNPIILLNNRYYLSNNTSTDSNSHLDSGIKIIINNIYNNCLVYIYNNDKTIPYINNIERDNFYNDVYTSLTAYNFINYINNIDKLCFSNYIEYIIIDIDGINSYSFDNNISNLPYLLSTIPIDKVESRISSLIKSKNNDFNFPVNHLLGKNNLITVNTLNYFSGNYISNSITKNHNDDIITPIYSGNTNNIYKNIYRYSGDYCPIFYKIDLFKNDNYQFNTDSENFGMMKERIISKVNGNGNLLYSLNNVKSIYPMIDQFGYTYLDYFIFKSNWDLNFYIQTNTNK